MISTTRFVADLTKTFTAGDGVARQSTSIIWEPILMDFIARLMDCLFDRFGPPQTVAEKAVQVKERIEQSRHPRGNPNGPWGGWHSARVNQTVARLKQAGESRGAHLTPKEWRQRAIEFLNDASQLDVDQLAAIIAEQEHEEEALT